MMPPIQAFLPCIDVWLPNKLLRLASQLSSDALYA